MPKTHPSNKAEIDQDTIDIWIDAVIEGDSPKVRAEGLAQMLASFRYDVREGADISELLEAVVKTIFCRSDTGRAAFDLYLRDLEGSIPGGHHAIDFIQRGLEPRRDVAC